MDVYVYSKLLVTPSDLRIKRIRVARFNYQSLALHLFIRPTAKEYLKLGTPEVYHVHHSGARMMGQDLRIICNKLLYGRG